MEVPDHTSEYRAQRGWRRMTAVLVVRAGLAVAIFAIVHGLSGSIEAAAWIAAIALTPQVLAKR